MELVVLKEQFELGEQITNGKKLGESCFDLLNFCVRDK